MRASRTAWILTVACALVALGLGLAVTGPVATSTARPGSERPLPEVHVFRPEGTPRGSVLVVHGGGWRDVGREKLARVAPWADRFRDWGYEVWSTTYRPGARSLADVLRVYDEFRASVPRRRAPCLYGQSAGGHLALMTAVRRPGVRGVVSAAGPTHLPSLPPETRALARAAFGDRLAAISPLRHADRIRAPLLLQYARYDRLVPLAQGRAMASASPRDVAVAVRGRAARPDGRRPAGRVPWVHGWVTPAESDRLAAAERRWLAATCAAPGPA